MKLRSDEDNLCMIYDDIITLCICPKNYEGYYCQRPIPNLCDFTKIVLNGINLLNTKNSFGHEYLSQNRLSFVEVKSSKKNLNFTIKVKCTIAKSKSSNRFSDFNNTIFFSYSDPKREIKLLDKVNYKYINFKYATEDKNLVFLEMPEIQVNFRLFDKRYYDNILISKSIEKNQILDFLQGEAEFNFEINFDQVKRLITNSGSLNFQLMIKNLKKEEELTSLLYSSQIEVNNQFPYLKQNNYWKLIVAVTLLMIIVVVIFVGYSYRKKNRIKVHNL